MSEQQAPTPRRLRRLLMIVGAAVVTVAVVIGVVTLGGNGTGPSPAVADMGRTEISGAEPDGSDGLAATDVDLPVGTTDVAIAESGAQGTALLRATVDPAEDVELSEGGSAFLTAAGGSGTVSATTFVPVRDGAVAVDSSAATSMHLEVLALFGGDADTAGSLRLLPAPVTVVDTEEGVGSDDLTTPMDVHVNGYAAPQGTPHVLARLTATFDQPSAVALSEQTIRFPAGTSTTTSVLATTEDVISISADMPGELEIDVIGYVTASGGTARTGADGDSTTAGAVMGLADEAPQDLSLAPDSPAEVELGDLHATAMIGLLSPGSGTAGSITSTYDDNAQHRGTAVTAEAERAGELVIVDGDSPELSADVDVQAQFLPVAIVQPHEVMTGQDVDVTIDSFPELEADAENGVLRFSGTFRAPHRIAAIRVEVDGEQVAAGAALRLDGNGGTWHQDIIPSTDGPMEVVVTAEDVGGTTATATWQGTVTVPADDEVVLSPQARVLTEEETGGMTEESAAVLASADAPDYAIGDAVVAGASETLPEGVLGQVLAIRYEEGRWLTVLGPATLGNVILQGDFDLVLDRADADTVVQRDADGDEQEVSTTTAGTAVGGGGAATGVAVGGAAGVGGPGATGVPVGAGGGATGVPVGGAAPLAPLPRMDGSAGEPRELDSDETYNLITHTCDEELEDIPLASEDEETTSADGLWALKGSTKLDAEVTCEANLGLRIAYSADYKPEGVIAVGLDAVDLMGATGILSDEDAKTLDGILTTAGSLYESDWTLSTSLLGTAEAQLTLTGSVKGEIATVDEELEAHLPLARATFTLGPVPVTLDGDVTLTPSLSLVAEGEMEQITAFSGEVESGLTLERGEGITPLSSLETDLTATASGTMSSTATAALAVKPSLTLYKSMSLSLTATPTAKATATGTFKGSGESALSLSDQDAVSEVASKHSLKLTTEGTRSLGLEGSFSIGLDLERELAAFPRILSVLDEAGVPLEVEIVDKTFAKTTVAEETLWEYTFPEGADPGSIDPDLPELDFGDDGDELLAELEGKTFVFSSGAGAWGMSYEMGADGTFTGSFHDTDAGGGSEPGTAHQYLAEFEGRFEIGEQIDETTYALDLAELELTTPSSGTAQEDDLEIEYVPDVYGLDQCRDFRLLLPDTPTSSLNDSQTLWSAAARNGSTLSVFSVTCYEEDRQEDIMHDEVL
ncbi:hypothetical protein [Brachybacterium paraconglomeratum]|uniref:hypothetical protein n=1 Tax=Brachybacterium paraconglomeratum TaxID=173362 RepID=UPI003FCF61E3